MNCLFPLCKRNAESNGYCILHGRHYSNSAQVKMPKEIPKESDSMKEIKKELKKRYPEFLKKRPLCEAKMQGCTGRSECVHHKNGRLKDNILNEKTWMAVCKNCNRVIEEQDALAREKGFKKSKFQTVK